MKHTRTRSAGRLVVVTLGVVFSFRSQAVADETIPLTSSQVQQPQLASWKKSARTDHQQTGDHQSAVNFSAPVAGEFVQHVPDSPMRPAWIPAQLSETRSLTTDRETQTRILRQMQTLLSRPAKSEMTSSIPQKPPIEIVQTGGVQTGEDPGSHRLTEDGLSGHGHNDQLRRAEDEWTAWERERTERMVRIEQLIQQTLSAARSEQTTTSESSASDEASVGDALPGGNVSDNLSNTIPGDSGTTAGTDNRDSDAASATSAVAPPNAAAELKNAAATSDLHPSLADLLSGKQSSALNGPIDRMGLADNLFAMGEFALSLQTYEQIDKSALTSEESFWVDYQIAGCFRRLKKTSEASDHYRRLASSQQAGRFSLLSKWWLDRIRDRSQLETDLQRYQQQIDKLKEHRHVKRANLPAARL